MTGVFVALLRRLARVGFRKGMGGGSGVWLGLGALSWLAARSKERARSSPTLYREVMKPGDAISVRIVEPAPTVRRDDGR